MFNIKNQKILVLAPHTDDGEFGCGASISKWSFDNEIHYVAFSQCEASVPEGFPKDVLGKECAMATQTLGLKPDQLNVLGFEVRKFPSVRQEILESLVQIRNTFKPDLVLIPSLNDVHQDHKTIAQEAVRAFKFATILSYELPWNNLRFDNTAFVEVSASNLQTKADAIAAYKSQGFRKYSDLDFIQALAKVRGVQGGVPFAEVFEVVRLQIK